MAQAATNKAKHLLATGGINAGTTDLRMGLLKTCANVATSTADLDNVAAMEAHADYAEITGAVSGYARVALTGEAATQNNTANTADVDAGDVSFGALGAGETIVGAFIFVEAGTDATRNLVAIYDLTSTPTNGGTVTVTTPTGILTIA